MLKIQHLIQGQIRLANRFLSTATQLDPEWENARPFDAIPRQSLLSREFLPGGVLFNKSLPEINTYFKKKHGNLVRIPSVLRRPGMVFSYDPNDFEKVYRTEGPWPFRLGIETISYWRRQVRKDVFKNFHGLVDE